MDAVERVTGGIVAHARGIGRDVMRSAPQRMSFEVASFACGYIAVWSAFSVAAALSQWALLEFRLISPMMVASAPALSGALLIAAGLYQFTAQKHACLDKCRSPVAFLVAERRDGARGAFIMGLRHGLYCVGCCWLLMLLLFVLGVMNFTWIAALSAFVLLEKTLPKARAFSIAAGVLFLAWGTLLLTGARVA